MIKIGFKTQGYIIRHILANFCQIMAIFAKFYRKFLDYRHIFPSWIPRNAPWIPRNAPTQYIWFIRVFRAQKHKFARFGEKMEFSGIFQKVKIFKKNDQNL